MRTSISFAVLIFNFQALHPMELNEPQIPTIYNLINQQKAPIVLFTEESDEKESDNQQQQPVITSSLENNQTWGNYFFSYLTASYRGAQSSLGLNDKQILYEEENRSQKIVTTYYSNIQAGINDPLITKQLKKRRAIACKEADYLLEKLPKFCTNYDSAQNRVHFLIAHNDEWKEITGKDIQYAEFLATKYPKELLPPATAAALQESCTKIRAIMNAIENANETY